MLVCETRYGPPSKTGFTETQAGIVVATIAFGMGVDKANIRYVYHYNLPKSLENYAQEIGRSGRDGAPSICQMLVCLDDLNVLENFVYGDTPTLSAIQSLLDDIFGLGHEFDVGYAELSSQHDIRILVVRTLLAYLELDGLPGRGDAFLFRLSIQTDPVIQGNPGPLCRRAQSISRSGFSTGQKSQNLAAHRRGPSHSDDWGSTRANRAGAGLFGRTPDARNQNPRRAISIPSLKNSWRSSGPSPIATPASDRA